LPRIYLKCDKLYPFTDPGNYAHARTHCHPNYQPAIIKQFIGVFAPIEPDKKAKPGTNANACQESNANHSKKEN
jgi:hypothetical protein